MQPPQLQLFQRHIRYRFHRLTRFMLKVICNFWKACYNCPEAESAPLLRMSRVCSMLQWSSEFICDCVLLGNKSFAALNWQPLVHDAYVDYIAEEKKLCDVFVYEYKARDSYIARAYISYCDVLLSYTQKNQMMCAQVHLHVRVSSALTSSQMQPLWHQASVCCCQKPHQMVRRLRHLRGASAAYCAHCRCVHCRRPSFPVSLQSLASTANNLVIIAHSSGSPCADDLSAKRT
jgi:hypothetical protein